MKRTLFYFLLAGLLLPVSAMELDGLKPHEAGRSWHGKTTDGINIMVSTEPKDLFRSLKTRSANGELIIDTRDFFQQPNARKIVMRFYEKRNPAWAGKPVSAHVKTAAEPAGQISLFLEGNRGRENKHYYSSTIYPVTTEPANYSHTNPLPADMNSVCVRLDLLKPAVYRIHDARLVPVKEERVDTTVNYITNGGAERGWYATGMNGFEYRKMADDNLIFDGRGRTWNKVIDVAIDSEIRCSGNASFRITASPDHAGRFNLNPVPFKVGKSASLSCWIKGEKPKQEVMLGLFLSNGIAYAKRFHVTNEWKKYELFIPEWGKKAPGLIMYGDTATGYGTAAKVVTPYFQPLNGTAWFDNVAYSLGGHSEFKQETGIMVSAKQGADRQYYFAGEPVDVELTLRNPSGKTETANIHWVLNDFFGKPAARSAKTETVTLKPNSVAAKRFTIRPPANLRGAMNLLFDVNGGKTGLYFGVIEKPGALNHRIGVNYNPGHGNVTKAVPLLKDFRIGALRLWSTFRSTPNTGFRDVDEFHKHGFYLMMCLGQEGFAPNYMIPNDFGPWTRTVSGLARRYRGKIRIYEILNEPNIWGGRVKNPDPVNYSDMNVDTNVRTIRELAKAIRSADPDALIGGPSSCHTDISWTSAVLAKGGAETLDVITEHPYRQQPELPDYESELQTLRKIAFRYKAGFPITASEAGERSTAQYPEHCQIPDHTRQQIAYNTRMMLIGFGNGLMQYYHFSFGLDFEGCGWHFLLQGNPDNNCHPVPGPVMFACRNAADRLEQAKPVERLKLGFNYRCYVFDRGDVRIAALWKWNGKPDRMRLPAELKNAAVYDVMGTRLNSGELLLNEYPLYLETGLPADTLKRALLNAGLSVDGSAFDAEFQISGKKEFAVKLHNLGHKPISGTVTANDRKLPFGPIAPEEYGTVAFRLNNAVSLNDRPVRVKIDVPALKQSREYNWNLRAILAPKVTEAPVIDGNLSDWPAQAHEFPLVRQTKLNLWTPAEDKIRATARMAWNTDHLYLGVTVYKKDYVESPVGVSGLWLADGIQFAFDPIRNATQALEGFQDDDFEYAAALVKDRPVVFRSAASAATYDSLGKEIGEISEVQRAIRRYPDRTVYEFAFPRQSVSPFRLQSGEAMRVNILVNIGNRKGRAGYLQLTPGIGEAPKRPGLFMDLVLLP